MCIENHLTLGCALDSTPPQRNVYAALPAFILHVSYIQDFEMYPFLISSRNFKAVDTKARLYT